MKTEKRKEAVGSGPGFILPPEPGKSKMNISEEIRLKRKSLREMYGGLMSGTQLKHELGCCWETAARWGKENNVGIRVGTRIKYDTDEVARVLITQRGFV